MPKTPAVLKRATPLHPDGRRHRLNPWKPKTCNRRELIAIARLEAEGFACIKRGWPDLAAVHPDGRVRFVEVKGATGKLKSQQEAMAKLLAALGATVEVWNIALPDQGRTGKGKPLKDGD